jgi:hypothetical protein
MRTRIPVSWTKSRRQAVSIQKCPECGGKRGWYVADPDWPFGLTWQGCWRCLGKGTIK